MDNAKFASRRTALASLAGGGGGALIAAATMVGCAAQAAEPATMTDALRQMDPNPAKPADVALALKIQELTGGPDPQYADVNQYLADDVVMEIGKDAPVVGKPAVLAYLPKFYQNDVRYGFDVFATHASGPVVMFSRIDRIMKPGAPERAIPVVAVFMFRKGLLHRWYELPSYINT